MEASQIIARRIGRIVFGGVLLAGLAYLMAAAFTGADDRPSHGSTFHAERIIAVTWLVAGLAGAIARRVAARARLTGAPDRLFAESWMAPTIGMALLLPITLHMPVVLLLGDSEVFDEWVIASAWVSGLAHVVFVTTCAMRAHQLASGAPALTPRAIYVATLVTSCVPFVLLYAIPPVIVAITALPLVPALRAMERAITRERRELAELAHPLPLAIVRAHPAA